MLGIRGVGTSLEVVGGSPLSPDQLAQLEKFYGFDKPWYEAYIYWLWMLLISIRNFNSI